MHGNTFPKHVQFKIEDMVRFDICHTLISSGAFWGPIFATHGSIESSVHSPEVFGLSIVKLKSQNLFRILVFSILDAEHGFPTYDAGIASDDLVDLKSKLSTAFDHGDLVVTTGGVSMGDKDLLRQILVQVSLFVLPSGHGI